MRRLSVIESSRKVKFMAPVTSATIERNRLMSWDSTSRELTESGSVTPSPKSSITVGPIGSVSTITKLIFESLAKLPYSLFKLGYEIAKLFTRGLSSIRFLLSGSKDERLKALQ